MGIYGDRPEMPVGYRVVAGGPRLRPSQHSRESNRAHRREHARGEGELFDERWLTAARWHRSRNPHERLSIECSHHQTFAADHRQHYAKHSAHAHFSPARVKPECGDVERVVAHSTRDQVAGKRQFVSSKLTDRQRFLEDFSTLRCFDMRFFQLPILQIKLSRNVVTYQRYDIKESAMPKEVDVQAKRSEFAEAAWLLMRDGGLPAATLRRVAAETRCTTGALTHYFPSREALLVEALRCAHFAAGARLMAAVRNVSGDLKRLEAILLEALPLDVERMKEWKTRLAVWAAASGNQILREENSRRYQEWGALLERYLNPIVRRRSALQREVVLLMSLVDGLALRLVLHAPRGARMRSAVAEVASDVRFHLRCLQARYQ
jgi:TetR/AcrR family transcriptional regulator, transcriptional repressor of bet genes